jgi:hypothetical protein
MPRNLVTAVRQTFKHSPLYPLMRRRRFHAYCVGGPKTGTTSIALMFRRHYLAAHEPLGAGTMDRVLAAHRGSASRSELARYLKWRDRELYLEMESSSPIAVFSGILAEIIPESKFILTVREPRAWLDSMINQQLKGRRQWQKAERPGPRATFFPALHDIVCAGTGRPRSVGERVLEENGLYSLHGYLSWWASHIRQVLESVPSGRLLVVRTESLSSATERIAGFVGVPVENLDREGQHANRASERSNLLRQIDPDLLDAEVELHCREVVDLIARLHPESAAGLLDDRSPADAPAGEERGAVATQG